MCVFLQCPSGEQLQGGTCVACPSLTGCQTYATNCLCSNCESGFDLESDGTCKAKAPVCKPIDNCQTLTADCKCSQCEDGYTIAAGSDNKDCKKIPNYLENYSGDTYCSQCAGPEILCEKLYATVKCPRDKPYCINKIVNNQDGTRSVWRGCGDFDQQCYKDWYLGTSDIDKCRLYDENNFVTLKFDCTFCCYKRDSNGNPIPSVESDDPCNVPLKPSASYLFKDF